MNPLTRVYIYEGEQRFFGEGPCRLLHAVDETGSLRAASLKMGISYSKSLTTLHRAEKILGYPLTEKNIGGKGGGGSRLTDGAREFMQKYEQYRDACYRENQRIFQEIFAEELGEEQ